MMPDLICLIMKFKQITSPGCPILLTSQIWSWPISDFWVSESYTGREFIRNGKGAGRKDDRHFNVNPDIDLQINIWGMEKSIARLHWPCHTAPPTATPHTSNLTPPTSNLTSQHIHTYAHAHISTYAYPRLPTLIYTHPHEQIHRSLYIPCCSMTLSWSNPYYRGAMDFEHMNIWTYEHMNIWKDEHLNIWTYEHMKRWTSEHMKRWKDENLEIRWMRRTE
jgi:hypothetical protein